jgi:hypothetical protein
MKNITHPTKWNRKFRRALAKLLHETLELSHDYAIQHALERYRKHFHTREHACLLLFHGLTASPSLRQSYQLIQSQSDVLKACRLMNAEQSMCVSYSQFAASNHSRDAVFMQFLAKKLLNKVKRQGHQHKSINRDIRILDSTCIKISPLLSSWAEGLANLRLQVQHNPSQDLPEHILLTNYRQNDCQGMDALLLENEGNLQNLAGHTLVVDLGYYSHKRFERMRQAKIHFVTRRHHQATVQIEQDFPVQHTLPSFPNQHIELLADQRITLGSANNRAGAVLPNLRLVTAKVSCNDGEITYEIITDRWDLTAYEVILFYLWRWEIELFFRWLKCHLCLERLLGYSPNAIALSVWLVVVVHLFTLLLTILMGSAYRSALFLRQLMWCWAQLTIDDFPIQSFQQLALPFWDSS